MKVGVNVGCGKKLKKSTGEIEWYNLDTHLNNGADVVHFLPDSLPFDAESLDFVYSSHVLEDFTADIQRRIMIDFWRVLKPGGVLHLKMPHRSNKCFVGSIYHMKPVVSGTFNALVKGFEEDNYSEPYKFEKYLLNWVGFHRTPSIWFTYGMINELLVNSCKLAKSLYEFTIWSDLFPAHECEWKFKK